ncbi:MAG TPA: nickel pincer cofactor biosynthesis protein LarC [Candidatus Hydrogenedentes bacterium]|nr:nickel pincer cofactor biosynthesis protein LarC [Candidatus Hydrogenedentota bacterium]
MGRRAFFNCFSGISGDMTVGALIDAGAPFSAIEEALRSLDVPGFKVQAERVTRRGLGGTAFRVEIDPDAPRPHRHLRHMEEIARRGNLAPRAREGALATFRLIAEAEATVHGTPVEKVHFHEVGAIDSIVDIIAANVALDLLDITEVAVSPVAVGSGTVTCDHGILPVPAPATALLLRGLPARPGPPECELATPTGVALLQAWRASGGDASVMMPEAVGYGFGTRELPDRPNALQVILGAQSAAVSGDVERDTVTVFEAVVDDLTGEWMAAASGALLEAGALDAWTIPAIGRKGRPAHCLTVLCPPEREGAVMSALFQHTTTLGARFRREERVILRRDSRRIDTPWGVVRVKEGYFAGDTVTAHPEFEDCVAAGRAAGIPPRQVAEYALARWRQERDASHE